MFSLIGQYALRVMAVLAHKEGGGALRAQDLAEPARVPPAYVSKVLRHLTKAGLLQSRRGHRGGFQLAREPEKIRIMDILRAVGADPEVKKCAFGWDECDLEKPCILHPVWSELSQHVSKWADSTTLAEVTGSTEAQTVIGSIGKAK